MTKKQQQQVWDTVDQEGFDYSFRGYSSFDEIKDAKFHQLRKAYVEAANALEEYVRPEEENYE